MPRGVSWVFASVFLDRGRLIAAKDQCLASASTDDDGVINRWRQSDGRSQKRPGDNRAGIRHKGIAIVIIINSLAERTIYTRKRIYACVCVLLCVCLHRSERMAGCAWGRGGACLRSCERAYCVETADL